MGFRITGREALSTLDRAASRLRRKVADAIDAADELDHREAEISRAQIERYLKLTDIRLGEIEESDEDSLDRLHQRAKQLLDEHDTYIAREAERLAETADAIADLEQERQQHADVRQAKIEAYEAIVAEVEARLKTDPAYLSLLSESDESAAIAERAGHKLALAQEELETKGAPYRSDPLFSYLWERGFRTPAYKASPLFRWLDGWVAHLCKYDQARANFARLNDIPAWLDAHAADRAAKADAALQALEAKEMQALEEGGADTVRMEAEQSLETIQAIDQKILQEETRHGVLAEAHADALDRQTGPAQEARTLIIKGLQRLGIPELRRLAAETYTPEDDDLVSDLVDLRKEELSIEIEADDVKALPGELKHNLSALEHLRRKFKSARYDSDYATFKPAVIEDAISTLLDGRANSSHVFRKLQRSVRRREPRTNPGFGGSRRTNSLGLPELLGEVAWEVLKQSQRGNSIGFPTRSPTRRSSKRGRSFPSPRRGGSGRKGGGWRTGGGF